MSAPFADNLRRWNRECTGWEPSQSLLQRGADDAADLIDELYDALVELHRACMGTPVGGGDGGTYAVGTPNAATLNKANAAIRKARGEQA